MLTKWKSKGGDMPKEKTNNKTTTKDLDCEKWVGQVCGDQREIKEALKVLGREPKSAQELQKIIIDRAHKALDRALEKEEEQHKYTPW